MSWHKKTLIGFDTETTGLDLNRDEIISAGIVAVGEERDTIRKNWLIKPSIPVPDEAVKLHGIPREDIEKGMPHTQGIEEIISYLADHMNQGGTLVVFNAPFDMTILRRQAIENEIEPLEDRVGSDNYIIVDPLVLDRAANPDRMGRRNLQTLCRHYSVPFNFKDAHSAEADAIAASRLAWKMADVYSVLDGIDRVELFERQKIWSERQGKEIAEKIGKPVESGWPVREKQEEALSLS